MKITLIVLTLLMAPFTGDLRAQQGLIREIQNTVRTATAKAKEVNAVVKAVERIEKSKLKNSALYQSKHTPEKRAGYTRLAIAENMMLDLKGIYPPGFSPKWKYITYEAYLEVPYEDWINPEGALKRTKSKFAIGDYMGKAVLMFGNSDLCDCYADIVITDRALLRQEAQTFKVTNFTRILNQRRVNEKCAGNQFQNGGWEGQITLSANENGDILIHNLTIESYRSGIGKGLGVSYRFLLDDFAIPNEMSPAKAIQTIEDEIAAKKARRDFLTSSEAQIKALLKSFEKKYPKECRSCFNRQMGMGVDTRRVDWVNGYGDYAGTTTEYDPNLSRTIENTCNYRIKIIGIQQKYSDKKGYYYQEVVTTMEPNQKHRIQMGMVSFIFTQMVGLNKDMVVQDDYCIDCFSVDSIQWLRVAR